MAKKKDRSVRETRKYVKEAKQKALHTSIKLSKRNLREIFLKEIKYKILLCSVLQVYVKVGNVAHA